MDSRQWSPNLVLAWTLWVIGMAVICADLFIPSADDIGHVGLACLVAGKVCNDRELIRNLKIRERAAFDLGRDTAGSDVRAIR